MIKKIDILKTYIAAEDWHNALKLASSWHKLGKEKKAITQAWSAMSNPAFYKQMGYDVDKTIAFGIVALKIRYC